MIGTVPNLACRLCDEASPGQILLSQRVFAALGNQIEAPPLGERLLKGFQKAVPVFELVSWRELPDEAAHAAAGGGLK